MPLKNLTLAVAGSFFVALFTGSAGCVPKPKKEYTVEQVKELDSLEELMRVQAQTADPQFNHIGQSSITDAEYAAIADAGRRLQATSETLRTRHSQNRPPSFVTYASRLHELSAELVAATEAKDVAKTSTTLTSIRETCRTCHKEHR